MKKNSILIIIICLLVVTIGLILLEGYSINKIENNNQYVSYLCHGAIKE